MSVVLQADLKAQRSTRSTPGNIRNDFVLFADSANSDFIALTLERCLCVCVSVCVAVNSVLSFPTRSGQKAYYRSAYNAM